MLGTKLEEIKNRDSINCIERGQTKKRDKIGMVNSPGKKWKLSNFVKEKYANVRRKHPNNKPTARYLGSNRQILFAKLIS
jgi:hypothetical protein